MLFNSVAFIFAFLPICLFGYVKLSRASRIAGASWLVVCSLIFYGWGSPLQHVAFLATSITFNFLIAALISRNKSIPESARKRALVFAITINLGALAYFKYMGFALNAAGITGVETPLLPLGISFFTFTQIAYLTDVYRSNTRDYDPVHYGLFVTYFPHLIAGPVLYHREMLPQFYQGFKGRISKLVIVGASIFALGLAKKILLADNVAPFADTIFDNAAFRSLTMIEAWSGATAYALQIYFDFSAYSDMATGISYMFGIKLPMNFFSPYKSTNIIDFWRTWHITLSRFLREYLYIPLGGNRRGTARRYLNLIITMLLGGLWHGAGWTFLFWGGLHGLYLTINHLWRSRGTDLSPAFSQGITLLAVTAAWVFFRADTWTTAMGMIGPMFGTNGISVPSSFANSLPAAPWLQFGMFQNGLIQATEAIPLIASLVVIALWAPNTLQIFAKFDPVIEPVSPLSPAVSLLSWRPTSAYAAIYAMIFAASLTMMSGDSPFLYFRF